MNAYLETSALIKLVLPEDGSDDAAGLRGYDAIHLASALALGEVVLVTWGRDLSVAARLEGFAMAGLGDRKGLVRGTRSW